MEFIVPMGTIKVRDRTLINTKASINEKHLFLIGIGPDNTYEERLLEINDEESIRIISNNINYLRALLDKLDEFLLNVSHELKINITLKNTETNDPIKYLLTRLNLHDTYLRTIGDGWRRILDNAKLGKTNKVLTGADEIFIIYSGNNITLNLITEPIKNSLVEVITYTEGKATGIVRVRVCEDIIAKTDIRSPSSLFIISQTKNPHELNETISNTANKVRTHIINYVNDLLNIMKNHNTL
jgi:hypothetical protein